MESPKEFLVYNRLSPIILKLKFTQRTGKIISTFDFNYKISYYSREFYSIYIDLEYYQKSDKKEELVKQQLDFILSGLEENKILRLSYLNKIMDICAEIIKP